jgi:hypothetical protein
MQMNNSEQTQHNPPDRRFGVICQCCNTVNMIDLDHEISIREPKLNDRRRVVYALERIRHMSWTLDVCRSDLSRHLLADNELQAHLDHHVKMISRAEQLLSEILKDHDKGITVRPKPELVELRIIM